MYGGRVILNVSRKENKEPQREFLFFLCTFFSLRETAILNFLPEQFYPAWLSFFRQALNSHQDYIR